MTPKIMRHLWSVVEASQSKTLLQLDDVSLVQLLVKQTTIHLSLDCHETDFLSSYIQSRLPLIRDMAKQRQYS
ncbi:MAG: hypothetical protein AAF208_13415 [Cyanobacteria bacterium P01_A01_bin.45]